MIQYKISVYFIDHSDYNIYYILLITETIILYYNIIYFNLYI